MASTIFPTFTSYSNAKRDCHRCNIKELTPNDFIDITRFASFAAHFSHFAPSHSKTCDAPLTNVLGFADFGGVNNIKQCKNLTLKGNLFVGDKKYDYKEYNTMMKLDDMDN